MKRFFFALVTAFVFQDALSTSVPSEQRSTIVLLSKTLSYRCILRKCKVCPNGGEPTISYYGCRGCDKCLPETVATTTKEPVSTTEAELVSTTEAEQVSTTEAEQVSTTEAEQVSTTEAEQVSTTEAEQVSTTEPECPHCEVLECPYGKKITESLNVCPACDECLPKPECRQVRCMKPKNCPYGLVETVLSNSCPGCPVCRKCEQLSCIGDRKLISLPDACPVCSIV